MEVLIYLFMRHLAVARGWVAVCTSASARRRASMASKNYMDSSIQPTLLSFSKTDSIHERTPTNSAGSELNKKDVWNSTQAEIVAKRMNAVSRPLRSELIGRNGYVPEAEESEDVGRRQVALLVAGSDWPGLKRETPPNPGHVVRRSDVAICRWQPRTGSIVEILECGVYGPGLC